MVSFICDACGNTVKKTRVEKHYSVECRNCSVLSCLDCGIDFPGDSYLKHTSCVTEAEKYQGHLYQAKDKENKGETKQKEWLKNVHGITSNTNDPKIKGLLKRLSAYSNIPRKRKKFDNFCRNSVNVHDTKTLDKLWDLFNSTNTSNEESSTINENTQECKEISTSETSNGNDTVEEINGSDCKSDMDTLPTTTKKKKRKKLDDKKDIENGDVTNVVNGNDNTNEDDESITKIKKKKKKHVINEDTECNGKAINDTNQDEVENGEETNTETNMKSKKKKRKRKQENIEGEIEDGNEMEPQPPKKSKKSKKKKDLIDEIQSANNISEVTENKQENKKKKKKTGKKHKLNEEAIEQETEVDKENNEEDSETAPQGRFNWHKTIKTVLKESEDHELSLKKLRKKVLNAYEEHGIDHRAPTINESRALFDKKLKSYPKVKILKDVVKLVK